MPNLGNSISSEVSQVGGGVRGVGEQTKHPMPLPAHRDMPELSRGEVLYTGCEIKF